MAVGLAQEAMGLLCSSRRLAAFSFLVAVRLSNADDDPSLDGDAGQFMDECGGAFSSALGDVRDPSMKATGELLMKCAAMSSMLIAPPAGFVVGGGVMVAAGLMQAYGGGEAEPSVANAMDLIGQKFKEVNLKLAVLQSSVNDLKTMMQKVQRDVGTLFEDIHLGALDMQTIDGVYMELMGRIYAAKGSPALAADARQYAEEQRDRLSEEVFETFDPSNIAKYLQRLLEDTQGDGGSVDVSVPALVYQQVLATRLKLFTIEFSASIWKFNGLNANAEKYVHDLYDQVKGYNGTIERMQLPVQHTVPFLEHAHQECKVARSAIGLPRTVGECCCGLRCPRGISCGCPASVPPGQDAARACGVMTTTTTTTTCSVQTGGTCNFLHCNDWRGPVSCVGGSCLCPPGYCAVGGACSTVNCATDTGATCWPWSNCDSSLGPMECRSGRCMCASGYCAIGGTCMPGTGLLAAQAAEQEDGREGASRFSTHRLRALAALAAALSCVAMASVAVLGGRRAARAAGREPLLSAD